jgi:WD40 repeat protein
LVVVLWKQPSLSPDGQRVITSGSDGIYVYDAISLQDIGHLRRSQPPFHRDAKPVFSPDSQLLVMSYADTTAVVWDMETLTEVAVLEGHVEWITALAFSRDGSLMASGDRTGRMKVWATSDWSLLAQHRSELVRELAFQGTQRLVASNGFRAIRIWRLHDFVEETLLVHDDNVGILHVMADERRLVSGASDGTARLWDMNTGETLAIMQQPGNRTSRVMISPDELIRRPLQRFEFLSGDPCVAPRSTSGDRRLPISGFESNRYQR